MNIDFNILWFEDTASWYRGTSREIQSFVEGHNFVSNFKHCLNGEKIDDIDFNNYDLILMDYDLKTIETGDILIEKIRKNYILTDIIFYSTQYDEMKRIIQQKHMLLDGVYYTDRKEEFFNYKVKGVIEKIIKKSEEIVNLRGTVMDNTCEFDAMMKEILFFSYEKFTEEEKMQMNNKLHERLNASKINNNKKVDEILGCGDSFIKAIKSKNYVVDSYKVSILINEMLKILYKNYNFNYKIDKFHDNYFKKIIQLRNNLAHVRQNNDNDEYYFEDNNGNKTIISKELYHEIRGDLLKYKDIFSKINKFVVNEM